VYYRRTSGTVSDLGEEDGDDVLVTIQLNALAAATAAACNSTDNYGEHVVDEHCSMASVTIELRQQLIALIELSAVSK